MLSEVPLYMKAHLPDLLFLLKGEWANGGLEALHT